MMNIHDAASGPGCMSAGCQLIVSLLVHAGAQEAALGYISFPGRDYVSMGATDIVGGGSNTGCRDTVCCKDQCDANPSCGVFMFGTISWCTNCCWIKNWITSALAPSLTSGSGLAGVVSYVKGNFVSAHVFTVLPEAWL